MKKKTILKWVCGIVAWQEEVVLLTAACGNASKSVTIFKSLYGIDTQHSSPQLCV